MNSLLVAVVLAGLQSQGAPAQEQLTPPPPPPTEYDAPVQHLVPPTYVPPAPQPVKINRGPRIGAGVSLLVVGYVASIVNTTTYWFTGGASSWGFGALLTIPFGIVISAIPLVGPAAGILGDLTFLSESQLNLAPRMLVNVVSLALQVTGFVLLVTTPRNPKSAKRVAITGFGLAPTNDGASVGLGGTFDFPY